MAVDLEAIRKRLAEISGQGRTSRVQLWKPEVGTYRVRGLPWKNAPDGMPFVERRFYYIGDSGRILAPSQFGKPDPINDLIRKLYQSGSPDDRVLAKKLHSKMTAYMALIVRGQEDKGVMVWSFNPFTYQRLLSFYTDEEVGDILDPEQGFDLKVSISKSKKVFNGKSMMDITVDASHRPSKLHDDPEQAKKWLDAVPNIDDLYAQKTTAEIEQILSAWLASGASTDKGTPDEGTGRGAAGKDDLDKLVQDVKEATTKAATKHVPSRASKKPVDADVDDAPTVTKQSLDDAFNELIKDNEMQ